ncbi:related to Sorting assembly machinery 37 kDa subunit [Zygosaccharomyces bailii]|nr:related to Sorting assembly machinery 37 kDa subunit [Zygosaccharomyces bailii]
MAPNKAGYLSKICERTVHKLSCILARAAEEFPSSMGVPIKTFYLWGEEGKPSLVSPESIALYWFLNGYYEERMSSEIVFANNTDLSPNEELPLLVNGSKRLSGFVNIVNSLAEREEDGTGANEDIEMLLLRDGLLEYTNELTVLTDYQLYLNRVNYETFTRGAFSKLLYWPMWYNTPINYRALTRQRCTDTLGYLLHDDDPDKLDDFNIDSANLAQSKTFKVSQARKMRSKEELQNAKHNVQFLEELTRHLEIWIQIREHIKSDKVITADLLMWANVYVQLNLPEGGRIGKHIASKLGDDFLQTLKVQLKVCSSLETKVPQRDPTFQEQGNVIMSLCNRVQKFV